MKKKHSVKSVEIYHFPPSISAVFVLIEKLFKSIHFGHISIEDVIYIVNILAIWYETTLLLLKGITTK